MIGKRLNALKLFTTITDFRHCVRHNGRNDDTQADLCRQYNT